MENIRNLFSLKIISSTHPLLCSIKNELFTGKDLKIIDTYFGVMSARNYANKPYRVKIQLIFNNHAFYGTEYVFDNYANPTEGLVHHIYEVVSLCDQYMKTNNQKLLEVVSFAFGLTHTLSEKYYQELLEEVKSESIMTDYHRLINKLKEMNMEYSFVYWLFEGKSKEVYKLLCMPVNGNLIKLRFQTLKRPPLFDNLLVKRVSTYNEALHVIEEFIDQY